MNVDLIVRMLHVAYELTINYGWNKVECQDPTIDLTCHCCSRNCSGVINDIKNCSSESDITKRSSETYSGKNNR